MTDRPRLLQQAEVFFGFAEERERVRRRREAGDPRPWTEDKVMQRYRFCNVFREDDATTIWFREKVRGPLSYDIRRGRGASPIQLATAVAAFRWFNFVPTGEVLLPLLRHIWNRSKAEHLLRPLQARGEKLFTGAYLVKSPPGVDKLTGILDCIDIFERQARGLVDISAECRLQYAHTWMVNEIPYLGRFMAYEVVTDLRHTPLLEHAVDKHTWASAGPGCARGISWLTHGRPDAWSYAGKRDQVAMLEVMVQLLALSKDDHFWPPGWPAWELREVEHVLCEFDKWKRGLAGSPLKRRFD